MKAFVVLLLMGAGLQDRPVPAVNGTNDNAIILPDQEYVIGPADVIEVSVLKMPELSREYRVSADGTIEMPFLGPIQAGHFDRAIGAQDRKSTRLNSSHQIISYAVFCLKKKKTRTTIR